MKLCGEILKENGRNNNADYGTNARKFVEQK